MDWTPCVFVVEANFFVEGNDSVHPPPTVYTTADVLAEIRDRRSHERLSSFRLSHEIVTRDPTAASVSTVTDASRDSGNLTLLSPTDIRLLALALDWLPAASPPPTFDEWITPETFGRADGGHDDAVRGAAPRAPSDVTDRPAHRAGEALAAARRRRSSARGAGTTSSCGTHS
jgi:hypothetical protein